MSSCSFSAFVARPDIEFILHTIPHLVRMCRYPFTDRTLILDTAPLGPSFDARPHLGTLEQLRECCQTLIKDGVVDTVLETDYSPCLRASLYKKHFGDDVLQTHDFRGYPVLGMLYSFEMARSDFIVHFDSDMLMHQHSDSDWISTGIALLEKRHDIFSVSPRPGPPANDGHLLQRGVAYVRDDDGFFAFSKFTSRKFLLRRSKLESLLPITPKYMQRRVKGLGSTGTYLSSWERMVTSHLEYSGLRRADLDTRNAWTLHTPDHSKDFIRKLPSIIKLVEAGSYPAEQAGDYDLRMDDWRCDIV